jgi:hypothetical protein
MPPMNDPDNDGDADAQQGQGFAVIKVPMELLASAVDTLTQLTMLLKAAHDKAGSDIKGGDTDQDQGAGTPPPVGAKANGLEGLGAELDAMRRSRGA